MTKTCYLCNKSITEVDRKSDDHVLPKHLKALDQPKTKGYDYAGTLPTHESCNNQFGPETYCVKALKFLTVLHDESCFTLLQHKSDPSIKVMVINSDCLKEFTEKDLAFFKLIDGRENSVDDLSTPSFFSGKPKTNPKRAALFVSLAVLTKSTAALLIKRNLSTIPHIWKVLAIPYVGAEAVDFDEIFGNTKPFDIGVKVWLKKTDTDDWFAAYKAKNLLIFFLFKLSETDKFWNGLIERFQDAHCLSFEGDNLNSLMDYQWQKVNLVG